jgi:hypothetical protein
MDIRTLPGWPTYISVNGLPLAQPYITERDKRIMRSKIDELLKLIR